jgi:hypothetical protein
MTEVRQACRQLVLDELLEDIAERTVGECVTTLSITGSVSDELLASGHSL